jgi:hypothetical protein
MAVGAGWFQCPRTYRKTTKLFLRERRLPEGDIRPADIVLVEGIADIRLM